MKIPNVRAVFLLVVLVSAVAPGAAAQQRGRDDRGDRDDRDDRDRGQSRVDTTLAFDRRGTVALTIGAGAIVVTSWARDEIRVRARSEQNAVRVEATPSRLSLELARPRSGATRYDIVVPAGARVSARTTSGDVSVSGVRGGVEIGTQGGDVVVEDLTEIIDIVSLSGDIIGRALSGRVDARTTSGEVTLVGVKGDVDATTVSGDVMLRDIEARYVLVRSTSGDVSYDGSVDANGRYEFGSHSGNVYIAVPAATGALVTVATYHGSIDSDFPITLRPGEHGVGATRRVTFEIGKGNARISAESFSGDIAVRSKGRRPQN